MEYKKIIKELQDLLDRSHTQNYTDMFVWESEQKALEEAIEAIHRLIDLES